MVSGSLWLLTTDEQAEGIRELGRTRPYVDISRVGVWGWSGGWANTRNAMFWKPAVPAEPSASQAAMIPASRITGHFTGCHKGCR